MSKRHVWETKLHYIARLKAEMKTTDDQLLYAYYVWITGGRRAPEYR